MRVSSTTKRWYATSFTGVSPVVESASNGRFACPIQNLLNILGKLAPAVFTCRFDLNRTRKTQVLTPVSWCRSYVLCHITPGSDKAVRTAKVQHNSSSKKQVRTKNLCSLQVEIKNGPNVSPKTIPAKQMNSAKWKIHSNLGTINSNCGALLLGALLIIYLYYYYPSVLHMFTRSKMANDHSVWKPQVGFYMRGLG